MTKYLCEQCGQEITLVTDPQTQENVDYCEQCEEAYAFWVQQVSEEMQRVSDYTA